MKSVCNCLKEGPGNGTGFTAGQDSKSFIVTVVLSYVEDKCLVSSVLKDLVTLKFCSLNMYRVLTDLKKKK